jgi:hypothetical protein
LLAQVDLPLVVSRGDVMMRHTLLIVAAVAALLAGASARADPVLVEATGTVKFNVIQGNMVGVQPGDPVVMSFTVDSNTFVNSSTYPTRGYPIDLDSFSMTVGGRPVPIVNPQPAGQTAYFVLRNNDPAVDGFLLSTNINLPAPVAVNIIGLAPVHDLDFLVTFNNGDVLPSLDILDALGTYGTSNLSVFDWSIGLFGANGAEYNYQTISLSAPSPAPEPATLGLLAIGFGGLLTWRCVRRWSKTSVPIPGITSRAG